MIEQFEVCADVDECLGRLAYDNRLAVAVSLKHATNNPLTPYWKIHCFPDTQHFNSYPVSILMNKQSPMWSTVNQLTQHALAGGLFVKWNREVKFHAPHQIQRNNRNAVLTLEHIFIGWAMYWLFMAFAVGAFIAEHIIHWQMKRTRGGYFWKLAEMFIDGHRYFLKPKPKSQRLTSTRLRNIRRKPRSQPRRHYI